MLLAFWLFLLLGIDLPGYGFSSCVQHDGYMACPALEAKQ